MRTIFSSRVLWLGIALLIIGSGPLLASIIYGTPTGDANPNPIGLGMLAAFTFWPSIVLIVIGFCLGIARWRRHL